MKAKERKDDVEKFYLVKITRNGSWDSEPEYLKTWGNVLDRINSVFNTEKMRQHVRKIEGDDVHGSLECDTYGLSHLKVMFKKPYFELTKSLV